MQRLGLTGFLQMPMRYFNGDTELKSMRPMLRTTFAAQFGDVPAKRYDGFSVMVGLDETRTLKPIERVIEYKGNPSLHRCDARCMNATGKIMKCECSCGGKNHGRGRVACEAV
jgi:hypothetical protein